MIEVTFLNYGGWERKICHFELHIEATKRTIATLFKVPKGIIIEIGRTIIMPTRTPPLISPS